MKTKFANVWKRSVQPRKQRKYRANLPNHLKQKLMRAPLSKELRKKYNKRSLTLRVGDTIKVVTGQFKGVMGKIDIIDYNKNKIKLTGAELVKSNGQLVKYPIDPSNVTIITPDLSDKKRKEILERK
ncbi:50S ribosomal protein L24 [Candidatus Woesearchaeota archaeon]|jgi:large subunit ribosomal protein L24|nr:50S ribosomal protein L24 [Candidatus Woesearchaeota archaeon]|tara:strand:+ start:264 stop:644 length:381 start_codon:yes stop_codon:yes gene_type:complete